MQPPTNQLTSARDVTDSRVTPAGGLHQRLVRLTESHQSYVHKIIMQQWSYDRWEATACIEWYLDGGDDSLCLMLLKNDQPIGMGIFEKINDVGVEVSPWLLALWVEPEHRGNGYGRIITAARLNHARRLGYKRVYLDTSTAQKYHERFGWKRVCMGNFRGEPTEIMAYDL